MTIGTLPWEEIGRDIDRVIHDLYGEKKYRFAKIGDIAEVLIADPGRYPDFHGQDAPVSTRTAFARINHMLGVVRKWKVYSRSFRSVYLIPEGYFETATKGGSRHANPRVAARKVFPVQRTDVPAVPAT